MSAHLGFQYYYDLLGLDRDSYRVHYRFDSTSNLRILNDAPDFPQLSGGLSSLGNFYSRVGSGFFTGQSVSIQNATGIVADFWTHIFITEKTGRGRGVIFDSMESGSIFSGYSIGINDNNRLYFESYDQFGPFSKTSSIVLGKKNLLAVSKTNNLLTFYCYDFANEELLSDSYAINGDYVLSAAKGAIGNVSKNSPNFVQSSPFLGYMDEYIIIQEALSPASLRFLASGLASDYVEVSAPIDSFTVTEITGYETGFTGVTGIIGYETVVTGTTLDPFTNETIDQYGTIAKTGFLSSGEAIIPLTGKVTYNTTGESTFQLNVRQSFIQGFDLDEVSFTRKIDDSDAAMLYVFAQDNRLMNREAVYDLVEGKFQLDDFYSEDDVQVYLNGIAQIATGYQVTGDFYGSGIILSGDYMIEGYYLNSTGFFNSDDVLIYDLFSGDKQRAAVVSGGISGATENIFLPDDNWIIHLNGVALAHVEEYEIKNNYFSWANDKYEGVTGALTAFKIPSNEYQTGPIFIPVNRLPRKGSAVYLNGQRQLLESNYVENSTLDLIEQSGNFDETLLSLYNNDENFFEDVPVITYPSADATWITADSSFMIY